MLKKTLIIVGVSLLTITIAGLFMFQSIKRDLEFVLDESIEDIDFTLVDNGVYSGEYYYEEKVGITVDLEVSEGELISITYSNHLTGLGSKAESIKDAIIYNQSILVDDISGATTSSRVIKLAIMEAMKNEE